MFILFVACYYFLFVMLVVYCIAAATSLVNICRSSQGLSVFHYMAHKVCVCVCENQGCAMKGCGAHVFMLPAIQK